MAKRIPFKCDRRHITIAEFYFKSTPSEMVCEKCVELIREGSIAIKDSRHTIGRKDLVARRF